MKLVLFNSMLLLFCSANIYGQVWTLNQCVDSAYVNNSKISLALNTHKISSLKYDEARSQRLPKISINGEYKYFIELPYQLLPLSVFGGPEGQFKEAQFGVPHNLSANALLQVPIYSSELNGSIQKLETSRKILEIEVQKTYDQIYFEIAIIYRNAQLIHNQMLFFDTIISNTQRVKKNLELLASQKMANQNDVKKLELKLSALHSYQTTLSLNLQQIYNALQLLTGCSTNFEVEKEMLIIEVQQYDVKSNTDLALIELQKELVEIDLNTLTKSKYFPEIGFMATYGMQGFGYDQSPNQFLNFYPLGYTGIKLSYPIFNGTVTNKKIAQKNLELKNLEIKEDFTSQALRIEIENAILRIENDYQKVTLCKNQVALAKSIYEQEEKKNQQGLISLNDLLWAQNELIGQQQNYLQSIADLLKADLELKKITNNLSN